jgi:hypothetical protein
MTAAEARAVNFREVCCGGIVPKILYRSSHPVPYNGLRKKQRC